MAPLTPSSKRQAGSTMKHAYEVYGSVIVSAERAAEAIALAAAGEYDRIFWGQPTPKRRPEFDRAETTPDAEENEP